MTLLPASSSAKLDIQLLNEFYYDCILAKLARCVPWHQAIAARHTGDPRNIRAVAELSRLAKSRFSDVTPETWTTLSPHLEADYFNEAANLAVRNVGFRSRPCDINEFLVSIVDASKGFVIGGAK